MTQAEKYLENIGDAWTFTAIMPDTKLIFAHLTGKRTKINTLKLLAIIKQRTKTGETLHFSSDGNDDYKDAISSLYGELDSISGEIRIPENLCYTQVIKHIEKGKCTKVDKRIVFGTEELLQKCLDKSLVSHKINTSYIERSNLTMRQHNHRVERKSQGFSKEYDYFEYQLSLSIAYYNFCLPHRGLTYYEDDNTFLNTPAMESEITDHIWSMRELLNYPIGLNPIKQA